MKRVFRKIDIHKDFELAELVFLAKQTIHLLCTHMQNTTKYGKEYIDAFAQYKKVQRELDKYEDLLQACLEIKE